MPIAGGSLAAGVLTDTIATLYGPVGAGDAVHIVFFSLVNTGGTVRDVDIYVKRSGETSRRILPAAFALAASPDADARYDVVGSAFMRLSLSAGDSIEGNQDTGSDVEFVITGGTEAA